MHVDYKYRKYFSDYVSRMMDERDIRPWYVAYYSETYDGVLRSCLKMARLPGPITLIMMAELFECTVNDLLGYDYVEVEKRDYLFDSGRDTKHVLNYFREQLRGKLEESDIDPNEKVQFSECRTTTIGRLVECGCVPDTPVLIQICDILNCTPSELLGY
jgi:hypothetical protein